MKRKRSTSTWKKRRFQNGNVEKRHEHTVKTRVGQQDLTTDCDNDKTYHIHTPIIIRL